MVRILNPIRGGYLPQVVQLYAKKLNQEFLLEYSESNTAIHLIDSLRETYKKNKVLINLNNHFKNENQYVFKNHIDLKFAKLKKLNSEYQYEAEYLGNFLNIIIEDVIPSNEMLGRFLNYTLQISFEVEKYNYICLITNKENLDFINDYISKNSKKIQISQLQHFDETIIEPLLYDFEDNDYGIEIDAYGIAPYKLKYNQFLVAYLISNLK